MSADTFASPPIHLDGPAATDRLAGVLAGCLQPGDVLLLQGPVGAGKTALSRALIQNLQARDGGATEDVPSPTFTLVQTYETRDFEIWHADLYRVTHPDEVLELGLSEAFDTAVCLIEWPDRLGADTPPGAATLRLDVLSETERRLTISGDKVSDALAIRLARAALMTAAQPTTDTKAEETAPMTRRTDDQERFLDGAGWASANRIPLAGDASPRRYIRLTDGARPAILMDAAPETGQDVRPFVRISGILADRGLSVPEILAADADRGFLLLEDLGDALFSHVARQDAAAEAMLYGAAGDVLGLLQSAPPPEDLPAYTPQMADLAGLAIDWYAPQSRTRRADLVAAMAAALEDPVMAPSVLTHRDFHADNLIWLPERSGAARVGLLDFQDAMAGPPEYDLASLIHDPRRVVSPTAQDAAMQAYLGATGRSPDDVSRGVAICSAQRSLRILGVFARLCLRDGKSHYPDFIPRTWAALRRDLDHPALADLRRIVDATLPAPTPEGLETMRSRAGHLAGHEHAEPVA
ncbi:tRNA (adenosine(37)-N6)-threonylcarbamoyltransferase complex ATPase subunit type 1 TsaE [Jannaschia sp. 2305UL9-9]|uniref:tRNA (adenosine(37)-N6)-threonylcarbamoyltransferase complex ATPase subunit type 1 TsaE n=1 Tax=Jannaschia sp. 2305UL9-9 TaxID=3121638 RepID=UPI0035297458